MKAPPPIVSRVSFRQRLFIIFSLGAVGLSAMASLTTAWLTDLRVSALHVGQGLQITSSLARQSVLALLYQSPENVSRAVDAVRAFPAIGAVMILNRDGGVIVREAGASAHPLSPERLPQPQDGPQLVAEGDDAWHFVAPVFLEEGGASEAFPFAQPRPGRQLLGQVYVLMDKATLHEVRMGILGHNLAIALLVTVLVLVALHFSLKQMLRPLNELTRVMQNTEIAGPGLLADAKGPPEVVHMATTYNRMMRAIADRDKTLRFQNDLLEKKVALRTRELVQARDAALELSRHKSEFFANMSHELRTPLQAIIGFADVVREVMEDEGLEPAIDDVASIQENAQHLLAQINEILEFSRADAGAMTLKPEVVHLEEMVQQVEKTVQPVMATHGNHLRVTLTPATITLWLDGGKLRQILLNLLSNAAKFTRDGTVFLDVTGTDDHLTIRVTDSGIGIAPEHQESIFAPFRQVDGSATRRFQGTGLGLAIVQRFCHMMGGEVRVESVLGSGSTFSVTLPVAGEPLDQGHAPG